jgi:hypothetical protein
VITHVGQILRGEYFDCKVTYFDELRIDIEVQTLKHHKCTLPKPSEEHLTFEEHMKFFEAQFPINCCKQTYCSIDQLPRKDSCVQYIVAQEEN